MKAVGIIPARYASKRLPGKPLVDIAGKTLIHRVYEAVSSSKLLSRIIAATDDPRIADECGQFNIEFVMTPAKLPSGTDRIAHAYKELGLDHEIIVNIQGDEPFLSGDIIDDLLKKFYKSGADVGTLIKKIQSKEELFSPSVVKAALAKDNIALYFSRNAIPFIRNINHEEWLSHHTFWKHIGIYAYRIESLLRFTELPQSELEKKEKLEQLRLLEDGASYFCVQTEAELQGVDTLDDVKKVRRMFQANLR